MTLVGLAHAMFHYHFSLPRENSTVIYFLLHPKSLCTVKKEALLILIRMIGTQVSRLVRLIEMVDSLGPFIMCMGVSKLSGSIRY